jgi:hypothetical protein
MTVHNDAPAFSGTLELAPETCALLTHEAYRQGISELALVSRIVEDWATGLVLDYLDSLVDEDRV